MERLGWSPLGSAWARPTTPGTQVDALAVYDDGSGPALYVGGNFTRAGGLDAVGIAKWKGSSWSGLGNGYGAGYTSIHALTVFDDGTGPALYVGGGFFRQAAGVPVNNIARWDGSWSALGTA